MRRFSGAALLSILLFSFPGFSQGNYPVRKLRLQKLNADDGLSQGCITSIAQDQFGFMWFGTKDGLNRYDGYQFKVFRNDKKDSNSIADNHILSIVCDKQGLLWIKYFNDQADVFDPSTEKAWHLTNELKKEKALLYAFTRFIPSTDGYVYFTDKNSYIKINVTPTRDTNGFPYKITTTNLTRFLPVVNGRAVYEMAFISGLNRLYLSYRDSIVVFADADISKQITPVRYHYTKFAQAHPPAKTHLEYETRTQSNEVCAEDTINHRLLITGINCFTLYDEIRGTKTDSVIIGNYDVTSLIDERTPVFDNKGRIWLSAKPLILYDPLTKKIHKILSTDNNSSKDEFIHCQSYYQDKSGTIFIGTNGYGIAKFNTATERFRHIRGKENETFSLNGIYPSFDEKYLWLKKYNQVLVRLNTETKLSADSFPDPKQEKQFEDLYSANSKILAGGYYTDSFGLWVFATQNNALYLLDTSLKIRLRIPFEYRGLLLHSTMTPAAKDKLWVACGNYEHHALFLVNQYPGKVLKQFPIPFGQSEINYPFTSALVADAGNNVWLGTVEGLFRFNSHTETWKHYKHNDDDPNSLPVNTIFSLCKDLHDENVLWIGTNNGGLVKFNKTTGKCNVVDVDAGLPNNVIYSVLSDKSGNLWVSTNNGIARFNPETREVKYFNEKDGLQGNEFNRYASARFRNGELAFGGINGLNIFNPEEINSNGFHPKVLFTGFKISNEEMYTGKDSRLLNQPAFITKELRLRHDQNFITFNFIATDYSAKEKILYQYMLVGLDKTWQPVTRLNEASYTNLDPGDYTFKVRATNSDRIWSKHEASIKIYILPPWWSTWWFRISCCIIFSWALYSFFRHRLKQKIKLLELRNNLARDLHDEIGSTLSSISISSTVIQQKIQDGNGEVNTLLKQISSNTDNMMEAMSDIVWAVNTKNDRFENVVDRMSAFAIEILEPEDILVELNVSEQLKHVSLDMQQRKNLYLIFKEAINNIAKYAEAKNVVIDITQQAGEIIMKITDDGKGFDINAARETTLGGNGLNNMQSRSHELKGEWRISSEEGKGTEVVLKFPV